MASARPNTTSMGVLRLELPECPICFETMIAPIYNCQSGHSLCASCTANLCPAICPICRQPMTQMRNRTLEDIISKAKVDCPNKGNGCILILTTQYLEKHLKECPFRDMTCPLGIFGKCSWFGKTKEMLDHFKQRHPDKCNIRCDTDIELNNISVTDDGRYVYLVEHRKFLFVLTVKVDTIQDVAYWIVQLIGSKKIAQQHIYEVYIVSKQNCRRRVTFSENCFNDSIKSDEIYRLGRCCIMPLGMLQHFIKDKKLSFRFSITRINSNSNQNIEGSQAQISGPCGAGPRMPGPRGPRPIGFRPNYPKP